jgi:hypothetical protein
MAFAPSPHDALVPEFAAHPQGKQQAKTPESSLFLFVRFVLYVVVLFSLQADRRDPNAVSSDFIDMLMEGKSTTNLTSFTDGMAVPRLPSDALKLEIAMPQEGNL